MTSYDVKALFTSVPVDPSINIVKQKLLKDIAPKDEHVHPTYHHTTGLLPQRTYFLFQGKYYEQVHSAAMGSPIGPHITNLFM